MVLSAKGRYTYVPKFNGNRKLPEHEQLTVEIIRPRAEERGLLYSFDPEREVGLSDFDKPAVRPPITFKTRYRTGQILRSHIGVIKNLSVDENGETRPIVSGTSLAECTAFGVSALVQELTLEVLSDRLTEDEKKSTLSPSSLSTKDGPENGGTPPTTKNVNSSASDTSSGEISEAT